MSLEPQSQSNHCTNSWNNLNAFFYQKSKHKFDFQFGKLIAKTRQTKVSSYKKCRKLRSICDKRGTERAKQVYHTMLLCNARTVWRRVSDSSTYCPKIKAQTSWGQRIVTFESLHIIKDWASDTHPPLKRRIAAHFHFFVANSTLNFLTRSTSVIDSAF